MAVNLGAAFAQGAQAVSNIQTAELQREIISHNFEQQKDLFNISRLQRSYQDSFGGNEPTDEEFVNWLNQHIDNPFIQKQAKSGSEKNINFKGFLKKRGDPTKTTPDELAAGVGKYHGIVDVVDQDGNVVEANRPITRDRSGSANDPVSEFSPKQLRTQLGAAFYQLPEFRDAAADSKRGNEITKTLIDMFLRSSQTGSPAPSGLNGGDSGGGTGGDNSGDNSGAIDTAKTGAPDDQPDPAVAETHAVPDTTNDPNPVSLLKPNKEQLKVINRELLDARRHMRELLPDTGSTPEERAAFEEAGRRVNLLAQQKESLQNDISLGEQGDVNDVAKWKRRRVELLDTVGEVATNALDALPPVIAFKLSNKIIDAVKGSDFGRGFFGFDPDNTGQDADVKSEGFTDLPVAQQEELVNAKIQALTKVTKDKTKPPTPDNRKSSGDTQQKGPQWTRQGAGLANAMQSGQTPTNTQIKAWAKQLYERVAYGDITSEAADQAVRAVLDMAVAAKSNSEWDFVMNKDFGGFATNKDGRVVQLFGPASSDSSKTGLDRQKEIKAELANYKEAIKLAGFNFDDENQIGLASDAYAAMRMGEVTLHIDWFSSDGQALLKRALDARNAAINSKTGFFTSRNEVVGDTPSVAPFLAGIVLRGSNFDMEEFRTGSVIPLARILKTDRPSDNQIMAFAGLVDSFQQDNVPFERARDLAFATIKKKPSILSIFAR